MTCTVLQPEKLKTKDVCQVEHSLVFQMISFR